MPLEFWLRLDELVRTCPVVIDRPRGSTHPRYADIVYPLDYGYLAGTTSGDGQGIDVWVGGLPGGPVTAIITTLDLAKRDAEIKILVGCTPAEADTLLRFHNDGQQSAILIHRPNPDLA
jgi:inorganic pyrophosphatase